MPGTDQPPQPLERQAEQHYRRGNRFFDLKAWDQALAEWRRAALIWQARPILKAAPRVRWAHASAVAAFLFSVLLVYNVLFTMFARDPLELGFALGDGRQRSWWERFLDNGRPGGADIRRMGIREWWYEWKRWWREGSRQDARRGFGRPSIDEHWAELLRRYGRFGPFRGWELDYQVIAGSGLSRLGDYDAAIEIVGRALDGAKGAARRADLYHELANAHYYKGYQLQPDGLAIYNLYHVRKAAEAYQQSLREEPRLIAFGNLGWMYFVLGDYRRAEEYSRRALEISPGLDYVRLNLGLIHLAQGRLFEAFEAYRTVIGNNPGNEVYLGGINDLKEVLRDNPSRFPNAHLMIGLLAIKKGDFGEARQHLERFRTLPGVGATWKSLADKLLESLGNLE
ncbi:MAG: tetratricopeptide repeat protein [Candidatus Lambdaproteobacteria bacterium]|nr:tetratricopeptide repeat protein [Candidatus Lambdaproteobacteria bacterium]